MADGRQGEACRLTRLEGRAGCKSRWPAQTHMHNFMTAEYAMGNPHWDKLLRPHT